LKILIAEDENISRKVLEASLKKRGHEVIAVENGLKAWETFQKEYFPVLISDWLMPEMDGLELCRRIRAAERPSYSYVILVSALQGKSSYLQGMAAGADDFISKPFDPEELKARLIVAERIIGIQDHVKRLFGQVITDILGIFFGNHFLYFRFQ